MGVTHIAGKKVEGRSGLWVYRWGNTFSVGFIELCTRTGYLCKNNHSFCMRKTQIYGRYSRYIINKLSFIYVQKCMDLKDINLGFIDLFILKYVFRTFQSI